MKNGTKIKGTDESLKGFSITISFFAKWQKKTKKNKKKNKKKKQEKKWKETDKREQKRDVMNWHNLDK